MGSEEPLWIGSWTRELAKAATLYHAGTTCEATNNVRKSSCGAKQANMGSRGTVSGKCNQTPGTHQIVGCQVVGHDQGLEVLKTFSTQNPRHGCNCVHQDSPCLLTRWKRPSCLVVSKLGQDLAGHGLIVPVGLNVEPCMAWESRSIDIVYLKIRRCTQ